MVAVIQALLGMLNLWAYLSLHNHNPFNLAVAAFCFILALGSAIRGV